MTYRQAKKLRVGDKVNAKKFLLNEFITPIQITEIQTEKKTSSSATKTAACIITQHSGQSNNLYMGRCVQLVKTADCKSAT